MINNINLLVGYKKSKSKKILVINRKGGAGKSTLAISTAAVLTLKNIQTEIIDLDPQETSYSWGIKTSNIRSQKHSLHSRIPFSFASRIQWNTDVTVIDTPSNFSAIQMNNYLNLCDKILFPIQPTPIDIHSMLGFIRQLINSKVFLDRKIELAFVITRYNNKYELNLLQNVLKHLKHPTLGIMTDSNCYLNLYECKDNGEGIMLLDSQLWNNVETWILQ